MFIISSAYNLHLNYFFGECNLDVNLFIDPSQKPFPRKIASAAAIAIFRFNRERTLIHLCNNAVPQRQNWSVPPAISHDKAYWFWIVVFDAKVHRAVVQ